MINRWEFRDDGNGLQMDYKACMTNHVTQWKFFAMFEA